MHVHYWEWRSAGISSVNVAYTRVSNEPMLSNALPSFKQIASLFYFLIYRL